MQISDLPVDIFPLIPGYLIKSQHLASAAQVNKTWNEFVTPRLYERVSIFSWHKESKIVVCLLFTTLASYPHLAQHVLRLEIRDFPKTIYAFRGRDLQEDTVEGLKNCINLRSCTWTRDGALTDDILTTLAALPELCELEINGHDAPYYNPQLLRPFSQKLEKISVIMPSPCVVRSLRDMVILKGDKLKSFSMICKASGAVTDGILEDMAPTLVNLEHFSLTGCPKVTERGISAIISSNHTGLKVLSLENVSTKFDMARFAEHCTHARALRSLNTITLTVSQHISDPWVWRTSVIRLLSHSSLEKFHIYSTYITTSEVIAISDSSHDPSVRNSPYSMATALASFWTDLIAAHGKTLRRVSVLRMPISLASIKEICAGCPNLEELFVVANSRSVSALPEALAAATKLRTIHVNFPVRNPPLFETPNDQGENPESELDEEGGSESESGNEMEGMPTYLVPAQALELAKRCGPSLTQFGCNTRVWKIGRQVKVEEDGKVSAEVVLLPYENPDIPEPFLVVRT